MLCSSLKTRQCYSLFEKQVFCFCRQNISWIKQINYQSAFCKNNKGYGGDVLKTGTITTNIFIIMQYGGFMVKISPMVSTKSGLLTAYSMLDFHAIR